MSQAARQQEREQLRETSHRVREAGDHLTTEAPGPTQMSAERGAECYCLDCKNRVTVGAAGAEYGHDLDCAHSVYLG
jgi:hypothetical protein